MMLETCEPKTYQQWMDCFKYLSDTEVSDEYVANLKKGVFPGVERVMPQFLERIQNTVNRMLNRYTKICTLSLIESLEEGDFSNIEPMLYRSYRAMKRCRFYLNINFLPDDFASELDKKTVFEINRYWKELQKKLEDLVEETENKDIYDTLYYIQRLINKDRYHEQL